MDDHHLYSSDNYRSGGAAFRRDYLEGQGMAPRLHISEGREEEMLTWFRERSHMILRLRFPRMIFRRSAAKYWSS